MIEVELTSAWLRWGVPLADPLHTPVLHLGPLVLRPWRHDASDRSLVLRAAGDPDIARYSTVGTATTPAAADKWLAGRMTSDRCDWVMEFETTPVGRVSLAGIDTQTRAAEIGYWVLPEHRRKGHARTGASLVMDYGVSEMDLTALRVEHEQSNVASCTLASVLGFGPCQPSLRPVLVAGTPRHLWVHVRTFHTGH